MLNFTERGFKQINEPEGYKLCGRSGSKLSNFKISFENYFKNIISRLAPKNFLIKMYWKLVLVEFNNLSQKFTVIYCWEPYLNL